MDIKLVDGFLIRNTLDDEFALLHFHGDLVSDPFSKKYIPQGEIWLDHIVKDEADFLLKVESETDKYMAEGGKDYRAFAKSLCEKGEMPKFVEKEEKENDLTIQYLNGAIVRKYIDPYFVFGGHDLVYDYIPEKTIWLDIKMDPKEIPFMKIHELVEREYMENGKEYDDAHRFAAATDMEARRMAGVGTYPEDDGYPWRKLSNEEIIKKFYVRD